MSALRERREREAPEMAAGIRRQLRAMTARVAAGDLDALRELVDLQGALRAEIDRGYAVADSCGYDHPTIGGETGVSKQAVQQRVTRGRALVAVAPVLPASLERSSA